MNKLPGSVLLFLLPAVLAIGFLSRPACSEESIGQERVAYQELNRVRSKITSNITFNDYRNALVSAREYVRMLRSSDAAVISLRQVMSYYEQALSVWSLQADSEFPVDSLRTDEQNGAAILKQCPDISRFHYKNRDQIYVKDAVDCIWRQAAELLDRMPANLR